MRSTSEISQQLTAFRENVGNRVYTCVSAALVLVGAAVFIGCASGDGANRAWQTFLVNFLFWTGTAFGTILLSAVMTMSNARWGRTIKRFTEAPVAFLPVAFLCLAILFLGRGHIFPWLHGPITGHKAAWLTTGFLFTRNMLGFLALAGAAGAMVYHSVAMDLKAGEGVGTATPDGARHWKLQTIFAHVYGILYALILSLFAVDFIMSLEPGWVSTLFPAYYWMSSFYSGLAAVTILSAIAVKRFALGNVIRPKQFHDLGKLLLGFCIVSGDFFYAQFLVIWYGNMPEETGFIIKRMNIFPWSALSWTVLFMAFVIPFLVLLIRKIKMKPGFMLWFSVFILVAMWLERFLLVVPSIWKEGGFPLGLEEVLITLGFMGAMGLCIQEFLKRVPALAFSDPLFIRSLSESDHVEEHLESETA